MFQKNKVLQTAGSPVSPRNRSADADHELVHDVAHTISLLVNRLLDRVEQLVELEDIELILVPPKKGSRAPGCDAFGSFGEKAEGIRLVDEELSMNGLTMDEIDKFLMHQASRLMVRTVIKDPGVDADRAPFDIRDCGNTISSSIPIRLEKEIPQKDSRNYLISGFGIGFPGRRAYSEESEIPRRPTREDDIQNPIVQ